MVPWWTQAAKLGPSVPLLSPGSSSFPGDHCSHSREGEEIDPSVRLLIKMPLLVQGIFNFKKPQKITSDKLREFHQRQDSGASVCFTYASRTPASQQVPVPCAWGMRVTQLAPSLDQGPGTRLPTQPEATLCHPCKGGRVHPLPPSTTGTTHPESHHTGGIAAPLALQHSCFHIQGLKSKGIKTGHSIGLHRGAAAWRPPCPTPNPHLAPPQALAPTTCVTNLEEGSDKPKHLIKSRQEKGRPPVTSPS